MMGKPWRRWLFACGLVLPCTAVQAFDVYLPRTRAHIKCNFADGSYFEFKQREKWYFYAEAIPHAQTTDPLNATVSYVDKRGRRHEGVGTSALDCIGVGKINGRIFWGSGFEDPQKQLIKYVFTPTTPTEPSIDTMPRPNEAPHLQARLAELKSKEFVHSLRTPMVVALDAKRLLLEQSLTTVRHPDYPTQTVLYVLQSFSSNFGQTWTKPVLTDDAKLYEIGRTLKAQSWAPVLETIVLDSSMRGQ